MKVQSITKQYFKKKKKKEREEESFAKYLYSMTSVLDCPQTDTEDDYPILRKEVAAAVQLLKKGKSGKVERK